MSTPACAATGLGPRPPARAVWPSAQPPRWAAAPKEWGGWGGVDVYKSSHLGIPPALHAAPVNAPVPAPLPPLPPCPPGASDGFPPPAPPTHPHGPAVNVDVQCRSENTLVRHLQRGGRGASLVNKLVEHANGEGGKQRPQQHISRLLIQYIPPSPHLLIQLSHLPARRLRLRLEGHHLLLEGSRLGTDLVVNAAECLLALGHTQGRKLRLNLGGVRERMR